jgi:hypothetical protein
MKYFEINYPGQPQEEIDDGFLFTRASSVKRWLREYASKGGDLSQVRVHRHWYSRDDYVDCETWAGDEFLGNTVKKLQEGATMQWQATHKPEELR